MGAKEVLVQAKELISTEEKWTQGAYGRQADGTLISFTDPRACRFCTMGALFRASAEDMDGFDGANRALSQAIGTRSIGIVAFNDSHTHAEVMAMFDKAIRIAS